MSFPIIGISVLLVLLTVCMLYLSCWRVKQQATYRQDFLFMGYVWMCTGFMLAPFAWYGYNQELWNAINALLGFGLVPFVLFGIERLLHPLAAYWNALALKDKIWID